jgi:hypothetical protein
VRSAPSCRAGDSRRIERSPSLFVYEHAWQLRPGTQPAGWSHVRSHLAQRLSTRAPDTLGKRALPVAHRTLTKLFVYEHSQLPR